MRRLSMTPTSRYTTPRRPIFWMAVQGAPVGVMSATQVMPLESASSPPRMAESYQSPTSILALSSSMEMIQVV